MSSRQSPRILLVLDDERDFSGPSIVLFRLFKALVAQNLVDLRVICQKSPELQAALEVNGFDHVCHDFPLTYSRENLLSLIGESELRKRKREFILNQARIWGADLVHLAVHPLGPMVAPALSREGVPCFVHFHSNHAFPLLTPYRLPFQRCLSLPGVQALAVSDWIAANVAALGVPRARITRLYNGLPKPVPIPAPERNGSQSDDGLILGFIAQIRPEKGLEHFIRALSLLAQMRNPAVPGPVTGIVVGRSFDSDYLSRCCELASTLTEQAGSRLVFDFRGYCPDPFEQASGWDGVVVPSLFDDPLPTVAIESICRGTPTIAYARGGLSEILTDDRGTLVAKRNPAALAQAIASVLADDSPTRRSRRRNESLRLFSIDTMIETYLSQVRILCLASSDA